MSECDDIDAGDWTEEEMEMLAARAFEDADTAGPIDPAKSQTPIR